MKFPILQLEIRYEHDVVAARQRAMQIAEELGFKRQEQVRFATAVSEIARNAFQYAKGGKVEFFVLERRFVVRVVDRGPGIANLEDVLQGRYTSRTGLGLGMLGAKKLVDHFEVQSTVGTGTTVVLGATIPAGVETSGRRLSEIGERLAQASPENAFQEIHKQNQELVGALQEIENSRAELHRLNQELEETNRGVVALYAELDEKAGYLRRASELKTRFLSNMTHEFRTPVNSILSLCRILLDRIDGELTPEQEKQIQFIQAAAGDLSQLVNDLLDLAKVEAGKLTVQPAEFDVVEVFAALRGTLKPLLTGNNSIRLIFEEPSDIPTLYTDESKVAQILRNLISNALKFTPRGEVRVGASNVPGGHVQFTVTDTGVGIAAENQQRIFEEFIQLQDPKGNKLSGTGLGLPIAKRLTELLGGRLSLASEVGLGSKFTVSIPLRFPGANSGAPQKNIDPLRHPVLVMDGKSETVFACERFLKATAFQVISCRSIEEAQAALDEVLPLAIILDVPDQTEKHWAFLRELKTHPRTEHAPVWVVSDRENHARAFALGADDFHARPIERDWLLEHLRSTSAIEARPVVLLLDPDETSRAAVRECLRGTRLDILEVDDEQQAAAMAAERDVLAVLHNAAVFPPAKGQLVVESLSVPVVAYNGPDFTSAPPGGGSRAVHGSLNTTLADELLGQLRDAVRARQNFLMQR